MAANHESSDRRKGISTVKLHKITYDRLCAFLSHALSFRTVVDPFITFSAISEALEEL